MLYYIRGQIDKYMRLVYHMKYKIKPLKSLRFPTEHGHFNQPSCSWRAVAMHDIFSGEAARNLDGVHCPYTRTHTHTIEAVEVGARACGARTQTQPSTTSSAAHNHYRRSPPYRFAFIFAYTRLPVVLPVQCNPYATTRQSIVQIPISGEHHQ